MLRAIGLFLNSLLRCFRSRQTPCRRAATYDALGRMVEQSRSGSYTEIVYDPLGNKLALMNGTSTLVKAFAPLPAGATAVYTASGLAYYRHPDWLGRSRFASTTSRTMYNDLAYAPFGETYAQSGSTGVTDISFAGNNEDTVANLYDAYYREYGTQGRWPSPDPAGTAAANPTNPQSWNRYAYVMNNPVSTVDSSGLLSGGPPTLDCSDASPDDFQCNGVPPPGGGGEGAGCGEAYSPGVGGQACIGNDIFDAVEGSAGTYLSEDQFGNISFGWSYSLYSVTMNLIDAINAELSTPSPQTFKGSIPTPGSPTISATAQPEIYGQLLPLTGWFVFVNEASGTVEGFIPNFLEASANYDYFSSLLANASGCVNSNSCTPEQNRTIQGLSAYVSYYQLIYLHYCGQLMSLIAGKPEPC